jgi:hypothetical protein
VLEVPHTKPTRVVLRGTAGAKHVWPLHDRSLRTIAVLFASASPMPRIIIGH